MTREVQAVILVLVGSAIIRITIDDTFLNYVKEGMRPWLLLTGGALIVMGVLAIVDVFRRERSVNVDQDVPNDHEDHSHHGPRSAWLLLLPVLAIFLVAPPALGSFAAARDLTNSSPSAAVAPPLPPGDPVEVYVSDYVNRAVWDFGKTLAGRTVEITGFVVPNPEGGWWLTRMSLACCAADAFAGKIQIVDPPEGWEDPPADTWTVVTGEWVPGGGTNSDTAIPLLSAENIVQIEQPVNPYD
jgi:uncharacterized repeat protein (TIGR03943 family)